MDIDELIEQLRAYTYWMGQSGPESHDRHPLICDKAADALSTLQAELEEAQQERDFPCIYFRSGGLCRYGGDESEANICVFGPCPYQMTAADVDRLRDELEAVRAERDAAEEEITRLKAIMREKGIFTIPAKRPWENPEWNL